MSMTSREPQERLQFIREELFDIGSPEEFERVLIWYATGEEEER